jgi:hypothetical protein
MCTSYTESGRASTKEQIYVPLTISFRLLSVSYIHCLCQIFIQNVINVMRAIMTE